MKKLVLVLAIATLAIGGSAFAQDPNYYDNVGVYFDEAGTNNCDLLPGGTPGNAYLVFTKMTSPEILGWELKLIPSNMLITNFAIRGDAIDAAIRENEHTVGYPAPVPVVGGTFVAADVQLFIFAHLAGDPSYLFVEGNYFPLIPVEEAGAKVPAYIDGANTPFALHGVNGNQDVPVMVVNDPGSCGVVAEETTSWGNIKSLYR